MIYLERPVSLVLLFLIPLYIVLRRMGILARIAFPLTLGDWGNSVFSWRSPGIQLVRAAGILAVICSFLLSVFAVSGPVCLQNEAVFSGSGNIVMFVLDVSPSMAASDMDSGTRLDVGRAHIRSFVEGRSGTAFGLAALGSTAALLVPPTADHRVFLDRLDSLSIGEFGDGTALGLGITVAAAYTASEDRIPAAVILLTDGENNAGEIHPDTAAGLLAKQGTDFYVIGIGSRGSVPVEYVDPGTGVHYSGVLDSDYDDAVLAAIAAAGNGSFISALDNRALQEVFTSLDHSVPVVRSSWNRTVEKPLAGILIRYILFFAAFAWFCRRIVMGAVL